MREIKFRAWDNELKCWIGNLGMKSNNVLCSGNEKRISVMQYTGLKDKNNKEIYEGDVCRLFSCDRPIEYVGGCFGYWTELNNDGASFIPISNYHFNWKDGKSSKIEVVSNIYENPDSLK